VGDSVAVPLVDWLPLQEPLAVQEVALVEDQVRVELLPTVMLAWLAEIATVGFGWPLPPQAVSARHKAAPAPSRNRRGETIRARDEDRDLPAATLATELPGAVPAARRPVPCVNIGAIPPRVKGFLFGGSPTVPATAVVSAGVPHFSVTQPAL
jgi:hypothetical protein